MLAQDAHQHGRVYGGIHDVSFGKRMTFSFSFKAPNLQVLKFFVTNGVQPKFLVLILHEDSKF